MTDPIGDHTTAAPSIEQPLVGAQTPVVNDDLSDGAIPSKRILRTASEVIKEGQSKRRHRVAAAFLVYWVVAVLSIAALHVIHKLAKHLDDVEPAAVGLVLSIIISLTVLTISLVRFAFAAEEKDSRKNETAIAPPSFEVVHKFGEMLGKLADAFKGVKP